MMRLSHFMTYAIHVDFITHDAYVAVMTLIDRIIEHFGGLTALARALGHRNPTTVQGWRDRGRVPLEHIHQVVAVANERGMSLSPDDFIPTPKEAA